METRIHGVYAALLTPRRPDESVDVPALEQLVSFLRERAVGSFVANGATGEFCLTTPTQLRVLLRTVRTFAGPGADLLCGVGAAGLADVLERSMIAADEGAQALLVPTPYFFPYQQDDLEAFYHAVASRVRLPILLYNLPQFTAGLLPETAMRLIREVPNIIGIKDSSGSLEILQTLTSNGVSCSRIIGNDGVLAEARRRNICDGVVSGVACVLPELIQSVFEQSGEQGIASELMLKEFIGKIDQFPVPWGLRWAMEARGIAKAWSSQPVSLARAKAAESMMEWFRDWHQAIPGKMSLTNTGN